ncbi:MAG: hypothetical protein AAF573_01765 [Bacteroidota bacterium]
MKYLTHCFILLVFAIGLVRCDYERIELTTDDCPDPTNPTCPCPNPSNPTCPITFNTLIAQSSLGCAGDFRAFDVVEVGGAGFFIVGQCNGEALILQVDEEGTGSICNSTQELGTVLSFFTAINTTNANRLVATGYTLDVGGNTDAFNFLINESDCLGGDASGLTGGFFQQWDQGNAILSDVNNIVIAGKWGGHPSILKLTDQMNMTANDIVQEFTLDSTLFENAKGVTLASVNNFPPPGHEILSMVQTSDGGFLATGFVDASSGGAFVRKAFVVKTKNDLELPNSVTLEMLDNFLPYENTTGYDVLEINNGQNFLVVGLGHDGGIPQNLANAQFPDDYPRASFEGFVALLGNDLTLLSHINWTNNADEDFLFTAANTGSGSFLVSGVNTVSSTTQSIVVKEFTASGSSIQEADNISITYSESGKKMDVTKIIKTNDGGYFVLSNQRGDGIRIIKTDDQGRF